MTTTPTDDGGNRHTPATPDVNADTAQAVKPKRTRKPKTAAPAGAPAATDDLPPVDDADAADSAARSADATDQQQPADGAQAPAAGAPARPASARAKTAIDAPRGRNTFLMYPEDIHVVGVDDDVTDPANPFFDERAVQTAKGVAPYFDPILVDDIDANGVVSPVKVVKDGKTATGDDRIVVNAGRRRTLHARRANAARVLRGDPRLRIEVMLEKGDERSLFLSGRRENVFRLQDNAALEAANMQRALKFGASEDEVASTFGTTVKTVRERLKLLELSIDVRQAVAAGEISPTAAIIAMRDVPRAEQGKKLKALLAEGKGNATVAALTAESKRSKREKTGKAPAPAADDGGGTKSGIKPPGKRAKSKLFLAMEEGTSTVPGDVDDGQVTALRKKLFANGLKPLDIETLLIEALTEAHSRGFKACLRWDSGDCGPRGVKGLSKALGAAGVKG